MSEKAYKTGILVGRFQILHKGHGDMIRKAQQICEHIDIFVGSSQESGTLKNPLSFEMRKDLLAQVFPRAGIFPLPDIGVGNTYAWGDYVVGKVVDCTGGLPDLLVSGVESRRNSWLDDKWNIAQLFVPKTIDISATRMIQFMLDDDRASWEQYIEPGIAGRYEEIRNFVAASRNNLNTDSI